MKKILISILLVASLSACGKSTKNSDTVAQQNDSVEVTTTDTLDNGECEDSELFKGGHESKSEDGRVTIRSDVHPDGGTAPDYWAVWTIINDKGEKRELKFEYSSYISNVHALKKNDGTTYYVVDCYDKASSSDGYDYLEAYRIVGDSIQEVNVVDGGKKTDDSRFGINYCIPNWYFTTNGAGYDWIFEYDAKAKDLYVPITEDREILDRYEVWHFNGDRFVCIGNQPHKDMHKSLGKYNRLIHYMTTKDYIVRVDSLDSHELRYASWKKPKTMADKPDIVIHGGKMRHFPAKPDELQRCDDYYFKSESYEYVVNYCETKKVQDGLGQHHDHLLVMRNGKVILKQEKESTD